jgi:hypothetical protein
MPDDRVVLLDLVMPHSVAADLGVTERELWQIVRDSSRGFPLPAVINLGGRHKVACFLKAEVAAWEAGNQLPQQTGRAAHEAHRRGMAEVA